MRRTVPLRVAAAASLAGLAAPAAAHGGTGLAGGFVSGFAHPLSGWDHLLAMFAVGLWGALLGRPLIWGLPVSFPLMMVGGAVCGMLDLPLPPTELGIAASVLTLGCCIAFRYRAPVAGAVAIVSIFALFHGYAHGRELPSAADPVGYSSGFVLATGMLHLAGIACGRLASTRRGERLIRTIGAAIGATGLALMINAA